MPSRPTCPWSKTTRFGLVVNLKTAKALGITFPQSIPIRADQVIRRARRRIGGEDEEL